MLEDSEMVKEFCTKIRLPSRSLWKLLLMTSGMWCPTVDTRPSTQWGLSALSKLTWLTIHHTPVSLRYFWSFLTFFFWAQIDLCLLEKVQTFARLMSCKRLIVESWIEFFNCFLVWQILQAGSTIEGFARLGSASDPYALVAPTRDLTPGVGIKFLRTGVTSANFVLLHSLDPLPNSNFNFFALPISNHISGKENLVPNYAIWFVSNQVPSNHNKARRDNKVWNIWKASKLHQAR